MMEQIASRITLHSGDCLDILPTLAECSIDSCVTDPPYGLSFMGRNWDHGVPGIEFWREVYRTLKPGAHLVAFGASRGYHRMACAIEDAGFDIRDSLCWLYGCGFPKSLNVSKNDGFCRCETCDDSVRDMWDGSSSLPFTNEKERANVLQSVMSQQNIRGSMQSDFSEGTGLDNTGSSQTCNGTPHRTDQSVMERRSLPPGTQGQLRIDEVYSMPGGPSADGTQRRLRDGAPSGYGATLPPPPDTNGMRASSGPQSEKQFTCEPGTVAGQSQSQDGGAWPHCGRCGKPMVTRGLGSALKPAFEPIVLARKPLSESTVAANVLRWRTGALNIDGCRVPCTDAGGRPKIISKSEKSQNTFGDGLNGSRADGTTSEARWPANVVHDGSAEVVVMFPSSAGQLAKAAEGSDRRKTQNVYGAMTRGSNGAEPRNDSGSAARFFFSAKETDEQWLARNLLSDLANDVPRSFNLAERLAVSALSNVVAQSMPQLVLKSTGSPAPSMNVTPSELRRLSETLIEIIQNIERRCSHESLPVRLSLSDNLADIAAVCERTDTIAITISLSKSNGCVAPAIFSITRRNSAVGVKDCAPSTARFHYSAKASKADRAGSKHPTVKPVSLMQWLCRLITPPGGTILDPFAGSGTTGAAARLEGFRAILIEREAEYQRDIRNRFAASADLLEAAE